MAKFRYMDLSVGLFMLFGLFAILVMVIKVSGISNLVSTKGYEITADFSDIGKLKVHAPVTIAGVKIGEVIKIELQPEALNAKVTMRLRQDKLIPSQDAQARILTEGLLGSNYISIVPGYEDEQTHPYLKSGDSIAKTQEAVILENLLGQLIFNINK